MKKMFAVLGLLLLLTGCERMAVSALSTVKEHKMDNGVVCYTYNTYLSCVKVTP